MRTFILNKNEFGYDEFNILGRGIVIMYPSEKLNRISVDDIVLIGSKRLKVKGLEISGEVGPEAQKGKVVGVNVVPL